MQRSRVLNLKSFNRVIAFISNNRIILILTVCFCFGFIFGIVNYSFDSDSYFNEYITEFVSFRRSSSFIKIFIDSALESISFVFVLYALGASIFGMLTSPILVILRAYFLGSIASLLYNQFSLKGVAFYAVLILPSAIFSTLCVLLAAENSVKFSCLLARLTIVEGNTEYIPTTFKRFSLKYLSYLIYIFVSALLDALISGNFLNKFIL